MSTNYSFIPSTLAQTPTPPINDGLPPYKELAYDFKTGQLKTFGGQYYYVEGNEAIKIWVYKTLKTPIDTYLAYSNNYGQQIFTLVGTHLPNEVQKAILQELIEDALLVNPYIVSITNFQTKQQGSKVTCSFAVNTIYGAFNQTNEFDL